MGIDVGQLSGQILAAFKGQIGNLVGDSEAAAKAQATTLAQAIADAGTLCAAGQINQAQAQDQIESATDDAQAALQGDLGIAALAAGSAVKAGLKVAVNLGLDALGVGFLGPILNNVIAGIGQGQA